MLRPVGAAEEQRGVAQRRRERRGTVGIVRAVEQQVAAAQVD